MKKCVDKDLLRFFFWGLKDNSDFREVLTETPGQYCPSYIQLATGIYMHPNACYNLVKNDARCDVNDYFGTDTSNGKCFCCPSNFAEEGSLTGN